MQGKRMRDAATIGVAVCIQMQGLRPPEKSGICESEVE